MAYALSMNANAPPPTTGDAKPLPHEKILYPTRIVPEAKNEGEEEEEEEIF
jgi:hypothetical protein